MISYELWTKKELIERLIILENDLVRLNQEKLSDKDVSDLVMEDHERNLRKV